MSRGKILFLIFIIVLILGAITYFTIGNNKQENSINNSEPRISEVDIMAENILQSLSEEDYAKFSKDFSANLKKSMNKSQFNELKIRLSNSSGDYISKSPFSKTFNSGYDIYLYTCDFEKEQVFLSLSFKENPEKIEGIWFDSKNLREIILNKG